MKVDEIFNDRVLFELKDRFKEGRNFEEIKKAEEDYLGDEEEE